MTTNFRTYNLAVELYRDCKSVAVPRHLKDQLLRAGSSVVLNLAEGSAKPTRADRLRFYNIAFGSLREVQAIFQIEEISDLEAKSDMLAACLYKLTRS